jgi:hypothetical protein
MHAQFLGIRGEYAADSPIQVRPGQGTPWMCVCDERRLGAEHDMTGPVRCCVPGCRRISQ